MRFLHTSDWQLGIARYYLDADARARHAADRFEAVRRLGELAVQKEAEFVVVAGDVFDHPRVSKRILLRGLEAMAAAGVPLYLLPANHDPLDAASVYRSSEFERARPENVIVLDGPGPFEVRPGVEVVAAPWRGKRPGEDLVARLAAALKPSPAGLLRVAVGHGAVDTLSPDRDDPARVGVEAAEEALAAGRFHYLALGDRHSATRVSERIWYSGSPEPTDFDEERPGRVLVVDLDHDGCRVEEAEVGRWSFVARRFELAGEADLDRLEAELAAFDDRPRTVLRLALAGELPLHAAARLEALLDDARESFAAVDAAAGGELVLVPDAFDRQALDLAGYAAEAFETLSAEAEGDDEEAALVARNALALLYRLAAPGGEGGAS